MWENELDNDKPPYFLEIKIIWRLLAGMDIA